MVAAPKPPPVDRLFRALADRTRLRILHLLRGGEVCVCDLQTVLRVPQAKVSRHLAYLRRAGLVSARKQGLWSYYALSPARDAVHRKLLECLETCFTALPEIERDAARLQRRGCDTDRCCDDQEGQR
jgi:ArsR family transcriptional regulator, arsenate/arsenite/antimonite-responsive transcriptional repressor